MGGGLNQLIALCVIGYITCLDKHRGAVLYSRHGEGIISCSVGKVIVEILLSVVKIIFEHLYHFTVDIACQRL